MTTIRKEKAMNHINEFASIFNVKLNEQFTLIDSAGEESLAMFSENGLMFKCGEDWFVNESTDLTDLIFGKAIIRRHNF